jgi:hypothetical protein
MKDIGSFERVLHKAQQLALGGMFKATSELQAFLIDEAWV